MRTWVHRSVAWGTGLALAVLGGAAGFAQSPGGGAAMPNIHLIQAKARLTKTLDAKKAKKGEPFTAKLLETVRFPNGQSLPANTVLEGHVDQATPSKHKSNSVITVTLDKARVRGGEELPIKATIIGMSEPALSAMQSASGGPPGEGPTEAGGAMGGQGPMGGGAMGPTPGMNNSQQSMGMGEMGEQRSGVPGVALHSSIHSQVSATFTASRRNVHVPGGVQLQIALAVVPKGVHLH